jgi:hypothetical protein
MREDRYTEVTYSSYGSKFKNSIAGVVTGVVLFLGSLPMLFLNEGRAVKTSVTLNEGAGSVIELESAKVDPQNNGKLIHLVGEANSKEVLRDNEFGISLNVLALRRTVEMYQWRERRNTKTEKQAGGGEKKITTYSYSGVWSSTIINSSRFKKRRRYQNPSMMPFNSKTIFAQNVNLGEFVLSNNLIKEIDSYEGYRVPNNVNLPRIRGSVASVESEYLYYGARPMYGARSVGANIGDIRIRFEAVYPQTVSAIAQQNNNQLGPYETSNGGQIELLDVGDYSAEEMFEAEQTANTLMTWGLRFGGFIMMFFGFTLLFKPLSALADAVPFLGSFVELGASIVALAISAPLSLITIGLAWITYRPILASAIIITGAGAGYIIYSRKKASIINSLTADSDQNDVSDSETSNFRNSA